MGGEASKETSKHPISFSTYSTHGTYLLPSTLDYFSESQPQQESMSPLKKPELSAYAKKNLKSLDPGFANRILECEMELEKDNISFDTLAKLVDLYMEAMSFYEAQQCSQYKYYADKLQALMLRPIIDEVIVKESGCESPTKDKEIRLTRLSSTLSQANTEGELSPQKFRLKRLSDRKRKSTILTQSTAYGSSEALSRGDEDGDFDCSYRDDNLMQILEIDECGKNELSDDENMNGIKDQYRRRIHSLCLVNQKVDVRNHKSGFRGLCPPKSKLYSLEMESISSRVYNKILFSLKE